MKKQRSISCTQVDAEGLISNVNMANVQTCKAGVTLKSVALNLWYVNKGKVKGVP